jgi:hypothetical protein
MTLLEQAKEAVRKSRDFAPKDGRRFDPAELDELGRLCAEAVTACALAGTTIAEMRLLLWQEERVAYRAQLAALARKEVTR